MKVERDKLADMGYIKFSDGKLDKTIPYGRINIDLDIEGNVIGIEVFEFSDFLENLTSEDHENVS